MPIFQQGSLNTTSLTVPDLYVQIVPPQPQINGVPSNILGVVGTATWGPVNSPTDGSSPSDTALNFGPMQARKFDLGTAVYAASLQGAAAFKLVRVTDGTDTAASAAISQAGVATAAVASGGTSGFAIADTITLAGGTFTTAAVLTVTSVDGSGKVTGVSVTTPGSYSVTPTNPVAKGTTSGTGVGTPTFTLSFACLTVTAKYTGSLGNTLGVTIGAGTGSSAGNPTFKVSLSLPGRVAESFDNIGGTGNALYANMASAINNGQGGLRGPSQLAVATAGAGTASPTTGTVTATGGTDGATTITSSVLVGQDTLPRKGMYALRGTDCSVAMLADADDTTQWTYQLAFGLSEGILMYGVSPAGDTLSAISTEISTAGIYNYDMAILFGDWVNVFDQTNQVNRLISPQGFVAGLRSALSPEQSVLNKQLQGIVGTQKSLQNQQYSSAELQTLALARVEVIANPCPGGSYFGPRLGLNTSSNAATNGDNYTMLTNYISRTLNRGMGLFIGKVESATVQKQAKATIDNFLSNMAQQGMIQDWKVTLDATNNPQSRVSQGYMQADVMVQYLSIIRFFLIDLDGGQTTVIVSNTPPNA